MNSAYVPDNTKSLMVIVLSLALALGLIAALLGLSEKPDISVLAVSTTAAEASAPVAEQATIGFDDTGAEGGIELDELGQPITDGASAAASVAADEQALSPVATPVPTPEPTPEVAAAVVPTPVPSAEPTPTAGPAVAAALSGPSGAGSGTVEGAFFTRPDEDDGATVVENRVEVAFNEDGSGSFRGVLDITYKNRTRVYIDMAGPLEWTTGNPQVVANVTGTYGFDSPIDADDVGSTTGELSITSLKSGSGSLCTPKCFGFTFPPQNGL
jgi:hypothetical protein